MRHRRRPGEGDGAALSLSRHRAREPLQRAGAGRRGGSRGPAGPGRSGGGTAGRSSELAADLIRVPYLCLQGRRTGGDCAGAAAPGRESECGIPLELASGVAANGTLGRALRSGVPAAGGGAAGERRQSDRRCLDAYQRGRREPGGAGAASPLWHECEWDSGGRAASAVHDVVVADAGRCEVAAGAWC